MGIKPVKFFIGNTLDFALFILKFTLINFAL